MLVEAVFKLKVLGSDGADPDLIKSWMEEVDKILEKPFPRSYENDSPQDPTVALCRGPYGGPRGSASSYERGIPVAALSYGPVW